MEYRIIPAILRSSVDEYEKDLHLAEQFANSIQVDVVDGIFAGPKTVDVETVAQFPSKVPLEIDLMVEKPRDVLPLLLTLAFVETLLVHVEAEIDQALLDQIKAGGKKVGLSLNPETDPASLDSYQNFDQILLMTVHPGKQGQNFVPTVLQKIEKVRAKYPNLEIEVDGGITNETLPLTRQMGANRFVVGSYIFADKAPAQQYKKLLSLL